MGPSGIRVAFVSDFADLADALERLSTIVGLTEPLDQVLGRVAQYAMVALKAADAASVALVLAGRPVLSAATDPRAHQLDRAQWELSEGPCLGVVSQRRVTVSGSLRREIDWPRWAADGLDAGMQSVLVAPMLADKSLIGTLSVYSRRENAFNHLAVAQIQRFSRPAGTVLYNLRLLHQSQAELAQLRETLHSQPAFG